MSGNTPRSPRPAIVCCVRPIPSAGRVAVPMLHVIDEHPCPPRAVSAPLVEFGCAAVRGPARRSTRLAMRAGRALRALAALLPAIPWNQFRKAGRSRCVDRIAPAWRRHCREQMIYISAPCSGCFANAEQLPSWCSSNELAHAISPREEAGSGGNASPSVRRAPTRSAVSSE